MSETGFNPKALREARERAEFSRRQFADAIGRGYLTVAASEHGVNYPSIAALSLIARTLNIRVSDLLDDGPSA